MFLRRKFAASAVTFAGLVGVLLVPSVVSAAAPDVVTGHLGEGTPSDLEIRFSVGASDPTPGVGLDARGRIAYSQTGPADVVKIFSYSGRVLCVNAVGDIAVVVAEVTGSDGPAFPPGTTHTVTYLLDGSGTGVTDAISNAAFLSSPGDEALAAYCQTPAPGTTELDGNVNVRDGS